MRYKCTSLLLGLLAGALHAGDGVLEINAACQSAGCFSGDDPGPPVQITQPGSYILTSNLSVNVNTTAILIESDNVTLNLNGFMLSGPVFCSGYPATCTQSGRHWHRRPEPPKHQRSQRHHPRHGSGRHHYRLSGGETPGFDDQPECRGWNQISRYRT